MMLNGNGILEKLLNEKLGGYNRISVCLQNTRVVEQFACEMKYEMELKFYKFIQQQQKSGSFEVLTSLKWKCYK